MKWGYKCCAASAKWHVNKITLRGTTGKGGVCESGSGAALLWQLQVLLMPVQASLGALPEQHTGNSSRQTDVGFQAFASPGVLDFNHASRHRHRRADVLQISEMRRKSYRAKAGSGGMNPGNQGEQSVVRMRAPGVRIGPRRLRRLRPRAQAQRQHRLPRPQQLQVLV